MRLDFFRARNGSLGWCSVSHVSHLSGLVCLQQEIQGFGCKLHPYIPHPCQSRYLSFYWPRKAGVIVAPISPRSIGIRCPVPSELCARSACERDALLCFPSNSFRFARRLSAFSIFFPAQGPISQGGKKMNQAKRILLIAATAVAVLTIQTTTFAMSASRAVSPAPVSTSPHMDGTHPMPPFPG